MNKRFPVEKLCKYVFVQGGYAFKSRDFTYAGVPVLKIKNIRTRNVDTSELVYVDDEVAQAASRYLLKFGDLLISMTGSGPNAPNSVVGRIARFIESDRQFLINQRVGRFINRDVNVFDLHYLFFVLSQKEYQSQLVSIATGSANQVNISPHQIESLEIPVPPIKEQRAIVDILGSLDDKIELNRQMNETLESIAKAVFKSWFIDFDPVRAKTKEYPAFLASNIWSLFPSALDHEDKPLGWQYMELGDALKVLETGSRPKGGVKGIDSGIPSVGAESIKGIGVFDFSKTKYVQREFLESMKKGIAKDRDVLLYKDGGRPGEFEPHVTMFGNGFPFEEYVINEHVYRIRVSEPFSQAYLYFHLTSEMSIIEMRNRGTGVAIPGLNSQAVRALKFLNPGDALLSVFEEITEPMVSCILTNAAQSKVLAQVRNLLLPKLLSGELRIKEAEKQLERVL